MKIGEPTEHPPKVPYRRLRLWLDMALRPLPVLACLLLALGILAPVLLAPGLPAGTSPESAGFALERAQQMSAALVSGHLPPRWMPDAAFGLGYPFWNYHGPLAWLFVALVAVLGGGIVGAIEILWLTSLLLAALGAWLLAEELWSHRLAGPLAALCYASSPLLLGSIHARPEALSELLAMALAPWLLRAAGRSLSHPSTSSVSALALLGALSWTADPAAVLMLSPLLLAWVLLLLPELPAGEPAPVARPAAAEQPVLPRGWRRMPRAAWQMLERLEWRLWPRRPAPRPLGLLALVGGIALGLLMAAGFLLPALLEREAVRIATASVSARLAAGAFAPMGWLDPSALTRYGSAPLAAPPVRQGLLPLLLGLLGLLVAWRKGGETRRRAAVWSVVVLACGLLSTRLALPLWSVLPLAPAEWAPWRWLAPQSLALALLVAALAWLEPPGRRRLPTLRSSVLVVLVAAGLLFGGLWQAPRAVLGVTAPSRSDIHAFEIFSGSLGTSPAGGRGDAAVAQVPYLPAAVFELPRGGVDAVRGHEGSPRAVPGFGSLEGATWTRREAARQDWQLSVAPSGPASIAFPTLGFPGWSVQVGEGRPRPSSILEGTGWLRAEVDPAECALGGRCSLTLRLGRSPLRALAEGLSLLAAIWWLALTAMDRRRAWGPPLLGSCLLLPLLVLAARALPTGGEAGPLVLTSEAAAWPHRRDAGIDWADAHLVDARFRLQGEGGPTGRSLDLRAGDRLELLLDWQPGERPLRVAAALVGPAEKLDGLPDQLVWDEQAGGDIEPLVLELPEDLADGLYFVRLDVTREADGRPVAAAGAAGEPLGQVYLGPLRLRGRPDLVEAGETLAVMGDVSLQGLDTELRELDEATWLRVDLTWRTARLLVLDHRSRLRLLDARDEAVVVEEEAMPFYGLLPTTAWPVDEPLVDRRWLRLPDDIDLDAEYLIEVEMLDGLSGDSLGSGRVGDLRLE